jgi:hypothetical protein
MNEALTVPFATAAVVLCIAGLAKLRSPASAVRALVVLGLPARAGVVRALAVGEVIVGAACVLHPAALTAGAMACLYATFCAVSFALVRQGGSCGCFGDETSASLLQSGLSATLTGLALIAAVAPPHGVGWLLTRPPAFLIVIAFAVAGSAYAAVLAYTELPRAWGAWGAR